MNNERADAGDDIDDGGCAGINQKAGGVHPNFQAGIPQGVCCAYLSILLHCILLHCISLHCTSDFPPLHYIILPSLSEHRTWFEICTSQEVYSHPDAVVLNFCSVFISIAVPCVVLKVYSHCSARAMPSQLPDWSHADSLHPLPPPFPPSSSITLSHICMDTFFVVFVEFSHKVIVSSLQWLFKWLSGVTRCRVSHPQWARH